MFKILTIFAYSSTGAAVLIWVVSGVMIGIRKADSVDENLKNLNVKLSLCRKATLFFVLLSWLVASSKQWNECVKLYREISDACLRLSAIWFISAFVHIVFSALVGLRQAKNGHLFNYMNKVHLSGFLYGTLFLIISYMLYLE